jgi:Mn2+/Fe2+ NRAMP family transporter
MPHNIYLHSALVRIRKNPRDPGNVPRDSDEDRTEAILYHAIEGATSLVIAVMTNLFVMVVFAASFYGTELADNIEFWPQASASRTWNSLTC